MIESPALVAPIGAAGSAEGLTSADAAARLEQYGSNAVTQAQPRGLGTFLRKFWGVIPWMLEFALIADLIVGRWVEALVIGALLVFNAVLASSQLAGPALERGREGHWRLMAQPHKVGTRLREDRREVATRTRRMLGGG